MPGGRKYPSLKTSSGGVRNLTSATSSRPLLRNGPYSGSQPITSLSSLLQTRPVHHHPKPDIPIFSAMGFEIFFLCYLSSALAAQYINVYKTNVHVVDGQLVIFLVFFLARRISWNIFKETLASEVIWKFKFFITLLAKGAGLLAVTVGFIWSMVQLFQWHSIQNFLFLIYPLIMYFWVFGFTLDPQGHRILLKLGHHSENLPNWCLTSPPACEKNSTPNSTANSSHKVKNCSKQNCSEPTPNATQIQHQHCSLPPDAVRYEAECLRTDFNIRIKQVLFQSLLCGYFVGFIPMRFAEQLFLYYDLWWSCQHVLFVWINSFIMLMMFMLPIQYCDALHKCALHLGSWDRYYGHRDTPHVWSSSTIWPKGVLVRHGKVLYKALGVQNVAIPGDSHHSRFYFMFHSPMRLINWMVLLHLLVVLYQLFQLGRCPLWHQTVSLTATLVFNYITLYRLLRDRWALQSLVGEYQKGDEDL